MSRRRLLDTCRLSPDRRLSADCRAVSETLGYVLVFSLIITTITTATVFGFGGLQDRQAAEQVRNVERAFEVMSDNFADISRYEDPSRATEIRLAAGTVGMGDPVTVTVGQWDGGSFVTDETTNVTFQPVVFQSDDGNVIYEGGVVFRADDSASIARSPLPFVVGEQTALVPIIATTQGGSTTAVGGERTLLVVGDRRPNTRTLENRTVSGDDLRIRIESPRADGWQRLLEQNGYVITGESADSVTAALSVDTARLPITRIGVRFT